MTACPFEFFSSHGLGISNSSLDRIGSIHPVTTIGQAQLKCNVNINNGNLVVEDHTLTVMEENFALHFGYVYNSQVLQGSTQHWSIALTKKMLLIPNPSNPDHMVIENEDGHLMTLQKDNERNVFMGELEANGRAIMRFDDQKQQWIWYNTSSQMEEIYDNNGLLVARSDARGRTSMYEYKNGELEAIVGPTGNRYEIRRSSNAVGKTVQIVEVANSVETLLHFHQFDHLDRLVMTKPSTEGYAVNYEYVGDTNQMDTITQDDGTIVKIGIQSEKVTSIEVGGPRDNDLYRYDVQYGTSSQDPAIIKDPARIATKVFLDKEAQITQINKPLGFTPADNSVDEILFEYQNSQLIKTTHTDKSFETKGYDPTNGLETTRTNTVGERMDSHYQPNTDRPRLATQVQWLDKKTPLVSRYVYDDNWDGKNAQHSFLRFKLTPSGGVQEMRTDPDKRGNVGSTREYFAAKYSAVADLPVDSAPSLALIEAWVKKQDSSQAALVALNEFGYDLRGQVNEHRGYTEVDSAGHGVKNATMFEMTTDSDRYGLWHQKTVKKIAGENSTVVRKYEDSLHRLTSETKDPHGLNLTTTHSYQDSTQQHSVQTSNGTTSVTTLNALQQIVDTSVSVQKGDGKSRTSSTVRDTDGRPIKHFNTDGEVTYEFFDREQSLGYTVSRTGIVESTLHDKANRFTTTIRYAQQINPNDMYLMPPERTDLPSFQRFQKLLDPIKANELNRVEYQFFDANGRLRYAVDAKNYVVEKRYDGLGREIATIAYANPISGTDLTKLKTKQPITLALDFSQDRVSQKIYNDDNLVNAEIDPAGYVTWHVRDAVNRLKQTRQYATKIPSENRSVSQENALLLPEISEGDALTYFYRDGQGRVFCQVNADGSAVSNEYYPCGKLKVQRQLVNKVSQAWLASDKQSPPIIQQTAQDITLSFEYDALLRQSDKTSSNNRCDHTAYDDMGEVSLSHSFDTSDPKSTDPSAQQRTQKRFDGWEQLTHEANRYVSQYMLENSNKVEEIWAKQSMRYFYDDTGLKTQSIDPMNSVRFFFYDDERRPIITINPEGAVSEHILNIFGEITGTRAYATKLTPQKLSELKGGVISKTFLAYLHDELASSKDRTTTSKRNNLGQIYQHLDEEKNLSGYEHNAFDQIVEENLPVADSQPTMKVVHGFDPRGLKTSTTKTAGKLRVQESWEFENYLGRQTAYIDPTNNTSKTKLDKMGRFKEAINGLDNTTKSVERDGCGRITIEKDAYKNVTTNEFNQQDRTQTTTYPVKTVFKKLTRDVFDQTKQVLDAMLLKRQWGYDAGGQQASFKAANLQANEQKRDLNGRLYQSSNHNNVETKLGLDCVGNVKSVTENYHENDESKGRKTTYDFTAFNEKQTITNNKHSTTEQQFTPKGEVEQVTVDKGESANNLNLVSTKTYNAQSAETSETKGDVADENQWKVKILRDDLGRQIGKVVDPDGLALKTLWSLDAAGRKIAETTPNGFAEGNDPEDFTMRFFYDADGKQRFAIGPRRDVTETVYDKNGRPICKRTYELPIGITLSDATKTKQVETAMVDKKQASDAVVWTFYDANGRDAFLVNALGIVMGKVHDDASNLTATIKYSNTIATNNIENMTTDELKTLMQSKADSKNDRIIYSMFDEANRERIIVDGCGYVTVKDYDAEGNEIKIACYATKITDPANFVKLPLEQALANIELDPLRDRITYHVYNEFNEKVFDVEPELGVMFYGHDEVGNQTVTAKYKTPLTSIPDSYEKLLEYLNNQLPEPTDENARITEKVYDNANRLVETKDEYHKSDVYKLDALGQTKTHTNRMKQKWQYQYDRAKRNTDQISPEVEVTFVTQKQVNNATVLQATGRKINIIEHYEHDDNSNKTAVTIGYGTDDARSFSNHYNENDQLNGVQIDNVLVDDPTKNASFTSRPENVVSVETKKIFNMKNLVIVEINQSGEHIFHVYDAGNREVFLVNEKKGVIEFKRNAFGEVVEQITYATAVNINLDQYRQTGIPLAVLQPMIKTSSEDRYEKINHDNVGNKISVEKGPVSSYSCTGEHSFHFEDNVYINTSQDFNAYGEVIVQAKLMDPVANTWTEELLWYDRNGNTLATAIKSDAVASDYFIVRTQFNRFNQESDRCEFANTISGELNPETTTIEALDHLTAEKTSKKDKKFHTEYNQSGSKKSVTKKNVQYAELGFKEGSNPPIPEGKDLQGDLESTWDYDDMQRPIVQTHEDGEKDYTFYDETGVVCARVGIEREVQNELAQKRITHPLTLYGRDVAGQNVKEVEYYNGIITPDVTVIPTPSQPDPEQDHESLILRGNRGEERVKQDPEGILKGFTYTRLREKLARKFSITTNFVQENNDYSDVKHMDEQRLIYDVMSALKEVHQVRDGNLVYSRKNTLNIFGEVQAESINGRAPYLYRKFDNAGRLWSSNAYKQGAHTLVLNDLSGNESCMIDSGLVDLSGTNYDQIRSVLAKPSSQIEKLDRMFDARGDVSDIFEPEAVDIVPEFKRNTDAETDVIPLSMVVDSDGENTTMSWVLPQERIFKPEFSIWPSHDPNNKKKLPIQYKDERVFVQCPANTFPSDIYEYNMVFLLVDPSENESVEVFHTSGSVTRTDGQTVDRRIQLDTGNNANSGSLVALIEDQNKLKLTGNLESLTGIQLYDGETKVADIPLDTSSNKNSYLINLSTYKTGTYTVKPVRNNTPQNTSSIPFTIYTAIPDTSPTVREIPLYIALSTLEEYGQLVIKLPDELQQKPIQLTVTYHDEQKAKHTEEFEIQDSSFFEFYFDTDSDLGFAHNFKLADKLKSVDSVSLKVQVGEGRWLALLNSAEPIDDQTPFPPHQKRQEREYLKRLVTNIDTEKLNNEANDKIVSTHFTLRQIIHVYNWVDLVDMPSVTFKDMTEDRFAQWHGLNVVGFSQKELTFDVSGMQPGCYPFYVNQDDAGINDIYFTVSANQQIYPSDHYFSYETQFSAYVRAMKLGLLLHDAKVDQQLSAQLENGQSIHFNELLVKPDAESGLAALGVPAKHGKHARVVFADFIRTQLDKNEVRLDFSAEVRCAFTRDDPVQAPNPQEWQGYCRQLETMSAAKATCRAELTKQHALHDLIDSDEEQFLQALKKKCQSSFELFCDRRLSEHVAEQQIQRYCSRKDVCEHYVNALETGAAIGHQSAMLYAKHHKISLQMWRKNANGQLQLDQYHDAGEQAHSAIHMLKTDDHKNFHLLQVADNVNQKDVTHELIQRAASYAQSTRRHRHYQRDAWHNVVSQTDPVGNTTDSEYDHNNTMVSQKMPPVNVLKRGTPDVSPKERLEKKWGFNKRGFNVFEQDQLNNFEGKMLNKANQLLQDVLPDGLVSIEQALDIFSNRVVYKDPAGHEYKQTFNRKRQLKKAVLPGGGEIDNRYAESGILRAQTTTGRHTSRYNLGINSDITDSFQPDGQHTQMDYNHCHGLILQSNASPKGGTLRWTTDDFGNILTHTNLSGMSFTTTRDFKNQPKQIRQTSGNNPQPRWGWKTRFGSIVKGIGHIYQVPWSDPFGTNSIAPQNLLFTYNGGLLSEQQDLTNGMASWYGYDGNKDKLSITVRTADELIQDIQTKYDGLRRETWSYDTMFIYQTWFDEVGNRARIKAQVFPYGPGGPSIKTDHWNSFTLSKLQQVDGGIWNTGENKVDITQNQGMRYIYDVNSSLRRYQQYHDSSGYRSVRLDYYPNTLLSGTTGSGVTVSYGYDNDFVMNHYSQTNPPGSKTQGFFSNSDISNNGWNLGSVQVSNSTSDDGHWISTTANTQMFNFRGTGYPDNQRNTTSSYDHNKDKTSTTVDDINRIALGFDTWKLWQLSVTRSNKYGSDSSIATNQYNSNGQMAAQLGVNDPNNDDPKHPRAINYEYTITPDGLVVKKVSTATSNNIFGLMGSPIATQERFFYSANMEMLGSYEGAINLGVDIPGLPGSGFANPRLGYIKHAMNGGRGSILGYQSRDTGWLADVLGRFDRGFFGSGSESFGYNAKKGGWDTQGFGGTMTLIDRTQPIGMLWCSPRGYMFGRDFGGKAGQSLQGTNPWVSGSNYQVQTGDSWAKIAQKVYGDPSYGELIAGMNGRGGSQNSLVSGQHVRIPQFLPTHNNDKTSLPFYLLLNTIYEQLYPALKTPQPKKHWWQIIVMVIAVAVAFFVAPELVGMLGSTMISMLGGSIMSNVIIGAVVAGVIDAAGQGLLVLGGLDTFSWSFLAQSIIGGAVGGAAQAGAFNWASEKLANYIISAGMSNLTQQLLSMAVGLQHKLDLRSVIASMSVAVFNAKVKMNFNERTIEDYPHFTSAVQNAYHVVPDAFITSAITGQPIDAKMMGVQYVAQTVGNYIGDKTAQSIHNNYDPKRTQYDYKPMRGHVEKVSPQYKSLDGYQKQQEHVFGQKAIAQIHSELSEGSSNQKQVTQQKVNTVPAHREARQDKVVEAAVNPTAKAVKVKSIINSLPDDSVMRLIYDAHVKSSSEMCVYKPKLQQIHPVAAPVTYTPSFLERVKLQTFHVLKEINDSAIVQKLANNVVADNLYKASLRTNRAASETVSDFYQGASELYHHPFYSAANFGVGLYNYVLIDGLDTLTGSTPESMHQHLHIAPYNQGNVGTQLAWIISIIGPEKFVPKFIKVSAAESVGTMSNRLRNTMSNSSVRFFKPRVQNHIETPYGRAIQSESQAALIAKQSTAEGAKLYRGGVLGESRAAEAQFWSLEDPLSPGYAQKYGIPPENAAFDFVEQAHMKPGANFITREAPSVGTNPGGNIEVVVNPNDVVMKYFHMPSK